MNRLNQIWDDGIGGYKKLFSFIIETFYMSWTQGTESESQIMDGKLSLKKKTKKKTRLLMWWSKFAVSNFICFTYPFIFLSTIFGYISKDNNSKYD